MPENNSKSFYFQPNYYELAKTLNTKREKLLYLESIIELGTYGQVYNENENRTLSEFDNFSKEIEQKLEQNKKVLSCFLTIKPIILSTFKKYCNGLKGKEYGHLGADFGRLGGRPKNPPKNPPKDKDKDKDKEEDKDNDKDKDNEEEFIIK